MHADIRAFLERGDGDFADLALRLFRWQAARNGPYGRIAEGVDPERVEDIPAVPVSLFKTVRFASFDGPGLVFRTSGTTGGGRGEHHLHDTALYDLGAVKHFRACVPDAPTRVFSLCGDDPDSSLAHMVALFGERVPAPEGPVFFAATAFALDAWEGAAALDARSVVMVTGGFKGRVTRLDAPSLYRSLPRLGSPRVVGEYGMTELSSQLWTDPVPAGEVPGRFRAPPWLRVYTVDPGTGEPVSGEGLLRFVDLANVDSVLAIETMDVGVVDGPWVELRGRLVGAEARGCSLRAEELLSSAKRSGV